MGLSKAAECLTWGCEHCLAGLLWGHSGSCRPPTLPRLDQLLQLQHSQCQRLLESGHRAPISHHFRYLSKVLPATHKARSAPPEPFLFQL